MASTYTGPDWLYLPLPANAAHDEQVLARVEQLCSTLPDTFTPLQAVLQEVRALASYEPAANRANELVWERFEALVAHPDPKARFRLVRYAAEFLPPRGLARVLRRLAKDPDSDVRTQVARSLRKAKIREVALPRTPGGNWDTSGWLLDDNQSKVTRHKTGTRILERNKLPVLLTLAEVRKLLNIKSTNQLGFFLVASDHNNGPYTTY